MVAVMVMAVATVMEMEMEMDIGNGYTLDCGIGTDKSQNGSNALDMC